VDYSYNPVIPVVLIIMLAHLALGFYEQWIKKSKTRNFFMPISYLVLTLLLIIWFFDPKWHL
jgi:uncharacterized membrane protein